jgi:hypothetical protein
MDQPTRLNLAFIGFAAPVKRGITNPASPRTARAKAEPQDGLFGIVLVANALIGIGHELHAKRTLDRLAVVSGLG